MSLSSSRHDSDFEIDEFDEKYQKMFPAESGLNCQSFGSEIISSSEQQDLRTPSIDPLRSPSGKFGSLERPRKNSRDLGLLIRRKTEDSMAKDDGTEKDDVFVRPRPPPGARKGVRKPLPLDYTQGKNPNDEKATIFSKIEERPPDVKRTQSWLVIFIIIVIVMKRKQPS